MTRFLPALIVTTLLPLFCMGQSAQAKYGNDFLSTGSGARALGMGSAHVAVSSDVTSAYWNAAGLASVHHPEFMYMHSERFGGVVGYDFGAVAYPLRSGKGVLSISFYRQGVDNIANTLNAWDRERDLPKQDAESYITKFSATDMAFFFSYAKKRNEQVYVGASAKVIRHKLGPFAQAWGYSMDVGLQIKMDWADLGVSVQDLTTMRKMWQVDEAAFGAYEAEFDSLGATLPSGQNEYVLPSIKTGLSRTFELHDFRLVATADVDLLFENRKSYYINWGRISFEPHLGGEATYKDRIALRFGLTDFITDPISGFTMSPTLGMGLRLSSFVLDYGFSSFAGASSELGFTHRISLRFDLRPSAVE